MVVSAALLEEVRPLAVRFQDAGFALYLVGGIVRDEMLGYPLDPGSDIDLTSDASPTTIKRLVGSLADAVWAQGERFGTIGCRINGRDFEITTHRGESYEPDSRKPSVVFGDAIGDDLVRRDFTVNAMAVLLPDGDLIDPFDGAGDLAAARLRTPLAPTTSFSDDPLRMLRAARFVAGYGLMPEEQLVAAVNDLASRMSIVSIERRRDELAKLLRVDDPRPGLQFMLDNGLAPFIVPDLAEADIDDTKRALDAVVALPRDSMLRLAALVACADAPDVALVVDRLREMKHSGRDITRVRHLVDGATFVWTHVGVWDAGAVRHLVAMSAGHVDDAVLLASTRIDVHRVVAALDELRATEDLGDLEPALDGDAVMALLGLAPGADVGRALAHLRELRLTEGPMSRSDASEKLRAWWETRHLH